MIWCPKPGGTSCPQIVDAYTGVTEVLPHIWVFLRNINRFMSNNTGIKRFRRCL